MTFDNFFLVFNTYVLKEIVSMRRFFLAPKTYAKIMGKKIFTILC